jgi:hypothetical protein
LTINNTSKEKNILNKDLTINNTSKEKNILNKVLTINNINLQINNNSKKNILNKFKQMIINLYNKLKNEDKNVYSDLRSLVSFYDTEYKHLHTYKEFKFVSIDKLIDSTKQLLDKLMNIYNEIDKIRKKYNEIDNSSLKRNVMPFEKRALEDYKKKLTKLDDEISVNLSQYLKYYLEECLKSHKKI